MRERAKGIHIFHYFEMRSFGNISFFNEKKFDIDGQITKGLFGTCV